MYTVYWSIYKDHPTECDVLFPTECDVFGTFGSASLRALALVH